MEKKTEKNNDIRIDIEKAKEIQIEEQRQWEKLTENYQPTTDDLTTPPNGPSGVPPKSTEE